MSSQLAVFGHRDLRRMGPAFGRLWGRSPGAAKSPAARPQIPPAGRVGGPVGRLDPSLRPDGRRNNTSPCGGLQHCFRHCFQPRGRRRQRTARALENG